MDVDRANNPVERVSWNELQWSHVLMDVDRSSELAEDRRAGSFNGATS